MRNIRPHDIEIVYAVFPSNQDARFMWQVLTDNLHSMAHERIFALFVFSSFRT